MYLFQLFMPLIKIIDMYASIFLLSIGQFIGEVIK